MSALNHPPDKATPHLEWGVDTAVNTGDSETKITPTKPAWQQGLTPGLVATVERHRRSQPADPPPPSLQLEVARSWREYARGTQ